MLKERALSFCCNTSQSNKAQDLDPFMVSKYLVLVFRAIIKQ